MIERERIYAALWRIASGSAQYATASRRLRHWNDVTPPEQPALFMSEKHGNARSGGFGLTQEYHLEADFYIYCHEIDPYIAPGIQLNHLIDALDRALAPDQVSGINNLGLDGMVIHTRIEGRIETDEGLLGGQAIAVVPVVVLAV